MSFSEDIRRFNEKAVSAHNKITRLATLELFRGVILATPVKHGRARGGWTTSVGAPAASPERLDPSGSAAVSEVAEKTPDGAGQVTYLSNNLPYIIALEEGSSKQAPEGMVKRNMDRVERMVDTAIRKNKV
ncbi:HK97 gp10 family phage protein [Pseudomonas sp. KSR10]|uniref:HK97 gp10 family phage protein n=1 Tax=Pseudomonas sp. KSR10 TaxID=2916654 RepID=UPI001EF77F92|nr:HK97 gp10 family phage protein [Pseudomonas sp. KSR10]MCG6540174.1 HK97 gp10 family phage protein [Pseudomonas sp. KSR10]